MTTPTLTLPTGCGVAPGASAEVKARTRRASFGDGYIQRSGDGINIVRKVMSLSFGPMHPSDAATIEAFLVARGGFQPFFWQHPYESTPRKWICETWKRVNQYSLADVVTAEFTEVFDP